MNSAYRDNYSNYSRSTIINLLVVDDDDVDQKRIKRYLSNNQYYKYHIVTASNYETALQLLTENQFDVCLFDYYLNDHTGLELLEKTQRLNPTASIIMLTGQVDDAIDEQLLLAGASDFLHKDEITEIVLNRAIRYAIHHKKMAIEHEHLAHYDELTQLVNRNLFFDRLTHLVESLQRHDRHHAVLYIDVDYFKKINDKYGHYIGDMLLKQFASRLLSNIRASDTAARLGGDEFAIILEGVNEKNARDAAQKILCQMEEPFYIENLKIDISVSIGFTLFPSEDLVDAQGILRQADDALYQAKHGGRKRYFHFDTDRKKTYEETLNLENDFTIALRSKQIFPFYQAQYCLHTGRLIGFEALARWNHPQKGFISPTIFIPFSEKLSLISSVTETMLKRACADLATWSSAHPHLKIAINISANECSNHQLLRHIEYMIEHAQIQPEQLQLEVTESVLINQPTLSIDILNSLHELGVSIAVDDFGTGYSSLSYLTELPIDTLKIDMSFVQGIGVNPQKEVIVKVIIDLAKRLSLKVIAEGVETKEQANFLKEHDCDIVQGYLYAKPCAYRDCQKILSENHYPASP